MNIEPYSSRVTVDIQEESGRFHLVQSEIGKLIMGNQEALVLMSIALLCEGHVLLEGVPGVAKTTMVKALAQTLGISFQRIQFTPDLLPSDILGSLLYNQKTHDFEVKKGPIFAHAVLADEINRAPAKVQSALLECMQERQITIGSTTYALEKPFIVFATQNPLEQEGTYRLPEAQVDRFMFKILVGYPAAAQEKSMLKNDASHNCLLDTIPCLLTHDDIIKAQRAVLSVYCDDRIIDYIVALVGATRDPRAYGFEEGIRFIEAGVSPRATKALYVAARGYAFLKGRNYVLPDDVKWVLPAIFRHRLSLTFEAESEGYTTDMLIKKLLTAVPVP